MFVTRPYVPSISQYMKYVEQAFDRKWLTNGGPLLQELTTRLKDYLSVNHLVIVNSGTVALQLAYKIKNLDNKGVITTPFTFPATSTALQWQGASVHLSDIDRQSWNLCPEAVKQSLTTHEIDAIVPVNIFGAPCKLDKFEQLKKEYDIPIIYDSAQAMLSKYKGQNIFDYGDIHCISFHATKLFHTVEGGAIVFNSKEDEERAHQLINFGFTDNGEVFEAGINAKMSELHAAMGLCILDEIENLIENRMRSVEAYKKELQDVVEFQVVDKSHTIPPMYMPIKLNTEQQLLNIQSKLNEKGYQTRRYFEPQKHIFLNGTQANNLIVTEEICSKILCLPLMHDLSKHDLTKICDTIKQSC